MPDQVRDRDGRVLGKKGLETRSALLDALHALVEKGVAWRRVTPIEVARTAGVSPGTFYAYFEEVEEPLLDLVSRMSAAGEPVSIRIAAILELMRIEGWKIPEYTTESAESDPAREASHV